MKCPVIMSNNERGIKQYNLCKTSGNSNVEYSLFVTNKRVILASSSNSIVSKGSQVEEIDINKINRVSISVKKKVNIYPALFLLLMSSAFFCIPNPGGSKTYLIVGIVFLIISIAVLLLSIFLCPKAGSIILSGDMANYDYLDFAANAIFNKKRKKMSAKVKVNDGFIKAQRELGAVIKNIQEENNAKQVENKKVVNAPKKDEDEIPEL